MLERLKLRIPEEKNDILLENLLSEAEDWICAYTMRKALPRSLKPVILKLAAVFYNRLGMEGESGHTEGGEVRTMEGIPKEIEEALRPYRRAKVGF